MPSALKAQKSHHSQEHGCHTIITCSSNGTITSWNQNARDIFGYSDSHAIGRHLFKLIQPRALDSNQQGSLQKLIASEDEAGGSGKPVVKMTRHKDGHLIPVEILATTIAPDILIVIVFDLSSKVESEWALQDAQDAINNILKTALEPHDLTTQLDCILDHILSIKTLQLLPIGGILLAASDDDKLILVAEHDFSEEQKNVCTCVDFGICHCGRAALSRKIQFVDCITNDHNIIFNETKPHGHYCLPIVKETRLLGVICLYVAHGHIPSRKAEDLLVAISNIVAGIIDSRRINEQLVGSINSLQRTVIELEDEKKFSESVIRGLNHGLIVTDLNFVVVKSNTIARQILAPFSKTLHRKSIDDIFGIEAAEQIISSADCKPSASNRLQQDITISTQNDGMEKIINYSIVPREDMSSRQVGYIISFSDMTELTYVRKEMEKMNRLSTVAEIASAVAHEVRNPLAGIKIMAQSIHEHPDNVEELMECSSRITKQVDRLNQLLTEFFTYARPVTPKRIPTSIETVLDDIRPLLLNKLLKKNIRLIEKFPKKPCSIIADPSQLQQVFLNLFLNAIDAIGENGEVSIEMGNPAPQLLQEFKRKHPTILQGDGYIQVLFADNGCGIHPEAAEKIFEPFFTTKKNGVGLGLSIVYRILTENKAAILVDSKRGAGTTFTMFFEIIPCP